MKKWPKDPRKTVSFYELIGPLKKALLVGYELRRKNANRNILYSGYDIGEDTKVSSFSPDKALKVGMLRFKLEDQGRDLLDVILGITLQLGIEQGKRILRSDTPTELGEMLLEMLVDKVQDKDLRRQILDTYKSIINGGSPKDKKRYQEIKKKMEKLE